MIEYYEKKYSDIKQMLLNVEQDGDKMKKFVLEIDAMEDVDKLFEKVKELKQEM